METYILGDTEVKMTGRTANKTINNPLQGDREVILYEVTPIDTMAGQWKRWVQKSELFKVTNSAQNEGAVGNERILLG